MPVCPQCDNRPFANKEALLQHMKTSSAWHPVCLTCDRRFSSQDAYNAHMNDKHPPTFDCVLCNRQFAAPYALEDHYRGSQLHPNCVRCGRGFKDNAACDEHYRTVHPKVPCTPCGGLLLYADALEQHYKDSGNHPSCDHCHNGFKDSSAFNEHLPNVHPDRYCTLCQNFFETPEALQLHFWSSPNHPKCDLCSIGLANRELYDSHLKMVHGSPDLSAPNAVDADTTLDLDVNLGQLEASKISDAPNTMAMVDMSPYSTGFTPLSPRDRMQALIVGERRKPSPDLRLDFPYSSPLTEVKPLFSPTVPSPLPRPGDSIEKFWTSRENITTSRPSFSPIPQPHSNIQTSVEQQTYRNGDPGPSGASTSGWFDPMATRPVFQPREVGRRISPPQVSPPLVPASRMSPHFTPSGPTFAGPLTDFNSRLYPGSVRQAMRAASLNRHSPPSSGSLDDFVVGPGSRRSFDGKGLGSSSLRSGSLASQSTSSLGRYRGASVDWSTGFSTSPYFSSETPPTAPTTETTTTTPKAEISEAQTYESFLGIQSYQPTSSPSLRTVSSPASSALGHSPVSGHHEPDTRPTTASSSTAATAGIVYTITPSSECHSPHSPEVSSPVGLGVLPTISPLATTPVDLYDFDIPEARKPLPDSPVEVLSPVTVVLEIQPAPTAPLLVPSNPLPTIIPTSSTSPSLSTGSSSYETSPQEPSDETPTMNTAFTSTTPSLSSQVGTTELTMPFIDSPKINRGTQIEAVPLSATRSNRSTTSTSVGVGFHPKPLHCRVCLADTCDDITASMCGHIFCNRCITDAVIKTNRCPVCQTPTLLYCLFRLDLAA